MAQETYKIPEVQWWGLPVGITFIVSAVALTFYVNRGDVTFLNGVIGAIALPLLGAGLASFAAFIYSIITHGAAPGEAKHMAAAESSH